MAHKTCAFKIYFMHSMDCTKFLFIVLAITLQVNALKVDMQGAVSIGKDVIDTLRQYIKKNSISGRRSMVGSKEADTITAIVKSAHFCRNLNFCEKMMAKFINEYVIELAEATESVIYRVLTESNKIEDKDNLPKVPILEKELQLCVRKIKKVLKSANDKITENNEVYLWLEIMKRINAIVQEAAIVFVSDNLEGKSHEIKEVKKSMTQKLVISTIIVEGKYETILCTDFRICSKSIECTKALDDILDHLKTADDEKVKQFITHFYEVLPDTRFYSKLSEMTANELQMILNEMSYSENVPTKDVLLSIHKAVKDRIHYIETNTHVVGGQDIELVNVILSDMDHVYGKSRIDPFFKFLSSFNDWLKSGGRLNFSFRQVMKDISKRLSQVPVEIFDKLVNEIKVFLEITIDPQ